MTKHKKSNEKSLQEITAANVVLRAQVDALEHENQKLEINIAQKEAEVQKLKDELLKVYRNYHVR